VLFSIAPVLHATRTDAAKPSGANASLSRPRLRIGQGLVVLQVMLAMALLCGAALFVRTFHNLTTLDGGFLRDGILTLQIEATIPSPFDRPRTAAEHRQLYGERGAMWERFLERCSILPNVGTAALATMVPLTGRDRGVAVGIEGRTLRKGENGTHVNTVSSDYFRTVGIPLRSGRLFTAHDNATGKRVAILNETGARAWFPDTNPIGRHITFPGQPVDDAYEVVGVVADARYVSLRLPDERMVYLPFEQAFDPLSNVMLLVRGDERRADLVPMIRTVAAVTVPGGFVAVARSMAERVDTSLLRERLLSMLATFFGVLALTLASVGLYGVANYSVAQRTREIGVRMALGAEPSGIRGMILKQGGTLAGIGLLIGVGLSMMLGQLLSKLLFGVTPFDVPTLIAVPTVLGTVTVAASWLPARRAMRLDPVAVIRQD